MHCHAAVTCQAKHADTHIVLDMMVVQMLLTCCVMTCMCGGRYLTQVQNAQDDDANTQAVLEQILGDQMHLAHSINKLLSLESAVYQ